MEHVLVIINEETQGTLPKTARECLTAGKDIADMMGADLTVAIVAKDPGRIANEIGDCGAQRFVGISAEMFAAPRYVTDCALVQAVGEKIGADVILAPGTSRWNRVLPGVAYRLNGRADLHVNRVFQQDGQLCVAKWYYRQRMECLMSRSHRPWLLGIDSGSYTPWQGSPRVVSIDEIEVVVDPNRIRTRIEGVQSPSSDEQTIRPDAELLFVAGAGWTKKQADGQVHTDKAAELILNFLHLSKASLGGSKSLVDLSSEGQSVLPFMTHLNQVGQTGATPRHPKGLATCCHGEEPHVVGWRFINERRAVNLDPNCGWAHGKADVLYVADAFAVIEKLNTLLRDKEDKA